MTWNIYSPPQLEFEVVGAGGKDSYIAVDDITVLAHPCQAQGLYQFQKSAFIYKIHDFLESLELIWYHVVQSANRIIHYKCNKIKFPFGKPSQVEPMCTFVPTK